MCKQFSKKSQLKQVRACTALRTQRKGRNTETEFVACRQCVEHTKTMCAYASASVAALPEVYGCVCLCTFKWSYTRRTVKCVFCPYILSIR